MNEVHDQPQSPSHEATAQVLGSETRGHIIRDAHADLLETGDSVLLDLGRNFDPRSTGLHGVAKQVREDIVEVPGSPLYSEPRW